MTTTLVNMEAKVRDLIGDIVNDSDPDFFIHSSSSIYTLTENNPVSVSSVCVNSAEIGDSEWSFDSVTNKVTITASLTSGDTVEIYYSYYSNYSPAEIQAYIKAALIHLSAANYFDYDSIGGILYPNPNIKDRYLICLIASILINPDNKTMKLPDVTILVPSDLPTIDKIRKVIMIAKNTKHGIFSIL